MGEEGTMQKRTTLKDLREQAGETCSEEKTKFKPFDLSTIALIFSIACGIFSIGFSIGCAIGKAVEGNKNQKNTDIKAETPIESILTANEIQNFILAQ